MSGAGKKRKKKGKKREKRKEKRETAKAGSESGHRERPGKIVRRYRLPTGAGSGGPPACGPRR
jgi:hypothetical protein